MSLTARQSVLVILMVWAVSFGLGWLSKSTVGVWFSQNVFISPWVSQQPGSPRPYLAYTIPALAQREYPSSTITIERELTRSDQVVSYVFSTQLLGRKMSGQLTVPTKYLTLVNPQPKVPMIVMLHGYIPAEEYTIGMGTKNAAVAYAKQGFVTIAPDFFGLGESDPEPSDAWVARFEKPMAVIELIKTLQTQPISVNLANSAVNNSANKNLTGANTTADNNTTVTLSSKSVGLWGHSNGGQIALSVLEILGQPLPTVLWSPMVAPFPYSILFFSYEDEDEGHAMRTWVSQLEKEYDLREFSVTHHLNRLTGPLQLHHGMADTQVLTAWVEQLVKKIQGENKQRTDQKTQAATNSAATDSAATNPTATGSAVAAPKPNIELKYFSYPGTDHNLKPNWDTAVERDLLFFNTYL